MKSENFEVWTYVGDVLNTAKIFNEKDADELIILDVQASKTNSGPNFNLIEEIAAECFLPLTYGGGVNSVKDALRLVQSGIDKISTNSAFLREPEILKGISSEIGSSSTIVSLDVKKVDGVYRLRNSISGKIEERGLEEAIALAQKFGAGELVIQSVDRDGGSMGPDFELCKEISKMSSIPFIVGGGIRNIEQTLKLWGSGADAVAAGSWFVFNGPHKAVLVTYPSRRKILRAISENAKKSSHVDSEEGSKEK